MNRIIFHIDLDAFFCAVEELYNYELKNIPFAITDSSTHGIVTTCNYIARSYGIKPPIRAFEALKICPKILFLKTNYKIYEQISNRFIDFIGSNFTNQYEQLSIDEIVIDVTNILPKYHNNPNILAIQIQDLIYKKLNLSVSIGISNSKILAKIASEMKKPKGIETLFIDEINKKLLPLSIDCIPGVGIKKIKFLNLLGIKKIIDFKTFLNQDLLIKKLGKSYFYILSIINGEINDNVINSENYHTAKSISKTNTFICQINDFDDLKDKLIDVANQLKNEVDLNFYMPKQISIKLKYKHELVNSKTKTLVNDFVTNDNILNYAIELFLELWNEKPVKSIALEIGKFHFQ